MGNIITVNLNYGCCRTEQYITDQKLYQYDYGQILKLTGIDLPALYEVHFSNSERGTSTTGIGTADGVEIPDQYLLNAGKLYVWLYTHTTEDDGETELGFWIPIIPRAQPTHEEPTPVQQTEIERLIALAEEIVEHGGGSGGGEDGFSPIVTVTEITGGHRISIQDKTHTATFDVMDGSDGDDGVSPTVSITDIAGGHSVTVTDAEHPNGQTFNVMDGGDLPVPEDPDSILFYDGTDWTTEPFIGALSDANVVRTVAPVPVGEVPIKSSSNGWSSTTITGLPAVTSSDNGSMLRVTNGAWTKTAMGWVPTVNSQQNGKILKVVNGTWTASDEASGLPSVTSSDEGKVLTVSSTGEWVADTLPLYTGTVV